MSPDTPPAPARSRGPRPAWVAAAVAVVIAAVALEVWLTGPVRDAVRAYTDLITAANRGDLDAARACCTDRYLQTHGLKRADEGGIVGLPRNINKNFQAWSEGREVWLCPTNRVGPVYRFVRDGGRWKFDGVVGRLVPGGRVEPMEDENEADS